jgi:hypothetical protein
VGESEADCGTCTHTHASDAEILWRSCDAEAAPQGRFGAIGVDLVTRKCEHLRFSKFPHKKRRRGGPAKRPCLATHATASPAFCTTDTRTCSVRTRRARLRRLTLQPTRPSHVHSQQPPNNLPNNHPPPPPHSATHPFLHAHSQQPPNNLPTTHRRRGRRRSGLSHPSGLSRPSCGRRSLVRSSSARRC